MAYLTLEADGRIFEANLTAARMLGVDRSALLGRRFQAVVGMSDPLAFRAVLRACVEQKCESRSELTFRTVGQQSYTVDLVLVPILKGSHSGRVRVAVHDVTGRAEAEQNLALSQPGRSAAHSHSHGGAESARGDCRRRSVRVGRWMLGRARRGGDRSLADRTAAPEDEQ